MRENNDDKLYRQQQLALEAATLATQQKHLESVWLHSEVLVTFRRGLSVKGVVTVIDAKARQAWVEIRPDYGIHLPLERLERYPVPPPSPPTPLSWYRRVTVKVRSLCGSTSHEPPAQKERNDHHVKENN